MYSGDETLGDEVTSPLYRPLYLPCGLVNPLARFKTDAQLAAEAQPDEDAECLTCDGRGGTLSYDSDGDGAWAMTVTNLEYCPEGY